jgi:hypothetical protein
VNKHATPAFVFKNANLSSADFSQARFIHPFTKQRLTMPQVVEVAMQQPPPPGQVELKQALKDMFTEAGHVKDKPPIFIKRNEIVNKNFVENVLQMKPRTFKDAN